MTTLVRRLLSLARPRQLTSSLGFVPGDFGEAMRLQCLLLNAFSLQSHSHDELARLF
jgi:hypothetical protein